MDRDRPEDARTPSRHGYPASQAQTLLPPFTEHIPANSQQFTFPFPPSLPSQHRGHLVFRPPSTPAYGHQNHQPSNYPTTQSHQRNGPPSYAPTSQLRQPPPQFAPLSTLSDSRAPSSTYTRPPSPPPMSEDDLINPMQISEVARSKKRQHESDEENHPPALVTRPHPRPIAHTQQSADPSTQKTSSRPASHTSTKKLKASENSEGNSDTGALLPKTKTKPRPRAPAKASKAATPHGGRRKGAQNYSTEEDRALLTLIEKFLPIGNKVWDTVTKEFEQWCTAHHRSLRDTKSIKARYGIILRHARSKPTGDADRGEDDPYRIVLRVDDMITEKSGQLDVDDSELEEDTHASQNGGVIDISSDEAPRPQPAKFVTAKAYKASTKPVPNIKPRRGSNLAAATNTLTAIGAVFNPGAMQARDDQRMSNSVHLTQIASLQVENRELRMRIDSLQDRLQAEIRRADKAETQVEMYSMFSKQTSRHRRRSHRERYSSDDGNSSASSGHYSHSRRLRNRGKKVHPASQSPIPHPRRAHAAPRATTRAREADLFPPIASSSAVKIEDLPLLPGASMSPVSISMPPCSPSPVGVTLTFTPQKGRNGQLMLDVTPQRHHTTPITLSSAV